MTGSRSCWSFLLFAFPLLLVLCRQPSAAQPLYLGESEITGRIGTRLAADERGPGITAGVSFRRPLSQHLLLAVEGDYFSRIGQTELTEESVDSELVASSGLHWQFWTRGPFTPYAGAQFGWTWGVGEHENGILRIRENFNSPLIIYAAGVRWLPRAESRWGLRFDYRLIDPIRKKTEHPGEFFDRIAGGLVVRLW